MENDEERMRLFVHLIRKMNQKNIVKRILEGICKREKDLEEDEG